MRAPLSVIIPTLNAGGDLPRCIPPLMEGVEAGIIRQLVISDGGSTDDTLKLADAVGADTVTGPASRGGQIGRGVAAARGDWLLILHADTALPQGWTDAVATHIAAAPDKAAHFMLSFDSRAPMARVTAAWANLRARFGLPYGDQGLLIPRALYDAIGGCPDIPLMEDVAMARALRGRHRQLPLSVTTSARKYAKAGWFRQGARNLWRLGRYLCGASPDALARGYRR